MLTDRLGFRPVDVTAKDKAIAERLDKEREATKERVIQQPMSRSSSRQGADRSGAPRSPPFNRSGDVSLPPSPHATQASAGSIRSTFSFAAAVGAKGEELVDDGPKVNNIAEQLGEVTI